MRRVVLIDFRPVFEVQTTFYIYSYDLSQLVMGRCHASATDFRRGKKSQQWGRCMPLPQTMWRFQSLALREDQPKTRESLCKSPIQLILWDLLGQSSSFFSGCQLNTLRRALRLLLRELRLNDLQLQDGSAGTAQLMVVECQHGSKCQRVSLQRLQFFTCQNLTSSNRLSPCTRWLGSQTCIEMSKRVSRG